MTKLIAREKQWKYNWCNRLQESRKIKYWRSMVNRTHTKNKMIEFSLNISVNHVSI